MSAGYINLRDIDYIGHDGPARRDFTIKFSLMKALIIAGLFAALAYKGSVPSVALPALFGGGVVVLADELIKCKLADLAKQGRISVKTGVIVAAITEVTKTILLIAGSAQLCAFSLPFTVFTCAFLAAYRIGDSISYLNNYRTA